MVPPRRLEPFPVKGERASSLHYASGSEAVLICRCLLVLLQFPPLYQLSRRGETLLSRTLTVSCFSLRGIAMARFLCILYQFQNSFRLPKRHDAEKYLRYKVLKMKWLKTNGRELLFYCRVSAWSQARHTPDVYYPVLLFLLDYLF